MPTSAPPAAPTKPPPIVAFVGDSYTAGAGASDPSRNFVSLVAKHEGWQAVNLGRGGTGYIATSSQAGCGLDYCPNYQQMVPDVVARAPSVVFVSGGQNDSGRSDKDFSDAVKKLYDDLRAGLPDARIIAASPLGLDDPPSASLAARRAIVKKAVIAVGGEYLDLGQPLGRHPELMADDHVHPNDEGHAAIASAIVARLP